MPDVVKGFRDLLTWNEDNGKVEDVFSLDYTYTYIVLGQTVQVAMKTGAASVTAENREAYLNDYIKWHTEKKAFAEYAAFKRGVFAVVLPKSLGLLGPKTLQGYLQGDDDIDSDALESIAGYEGYTPNQPYIKDFWEIVHGLSEDQKQNLLHFVTALDRIPYHFGYWSMDFVIQRNGINDDRLPTAQTCFSRLLLPEYSSPEILRKNLVLAIDNAHGFGLA